MPVLPPPSSTETAGPAPPPGSHGSVAAGANYAEKSSKRGTRSRHTRATSTRPQVLECPAHDRQFEALVSARPGVSHGEILCPEARGLGFPPQASPGKELVSNPIENIENGGVTYYVTPPTKKIIKNKKSKKKKKTEKSQRKYRGRGKKNSKNSIFTVFLTNLRGYRSKETSVNKIIRKLRPSVAVMNETQLIGNMKENIPQYVCWTRSRTEQGGGVIATAVSQEYSEMTVGAGEGEKDDEYLITRIEAFSPALNIVNSYGEQRKTRKEEVEGKWARLRNEL